MIIHVTNQSQQNTVIAYLCNELNLSEVHKQGDSYIISDEQAIVITDDVELVTAHHLVTGDLIYTFEDFTRLVVKKCISFKKSNTHKRKIINQLITYVVH